MLRYVLVVHVLCVVGSLPAFGQSSDRTPRAYQSRAPEPSYKAPVADPPVAQYLQPSVPAVPEESHYAAGEVISVGDNEPAAQTTLYEVRAKDDWTDRVSTHIVRGKPGIKPGSRVYYDRRTSKIVTGAHVTLSPWDFMHALAPRRPPAVVQGFVTHNDKPLPNARIVVSWGRSEKVVRGVTDDLGRYCLLLPREVASSRVFSLEASAQGLGTVTLPGLLWASQLISVVLPAQAAE